MSDKIKEAKDQLGRTIDTLDNMAHALKMPLPDKMHVDLFRIQLPEIVAKLKKNYAAVTGENPWQHEPSELKHG